MYYSSFFVGKAPDSGWAERRACTSGGTSIGRAREHEHGERKLGMRMLPEDGGSAKHGDIRHSQQKKGKRSAGGALTRMELSRLQRPRSAQEFRKRNSIGKRKPRTADGQGNMSMESGSSECECSRRMAGVRSTEASGIPNKKGETLRGDGGSAKHGGIRHFR